jgi:hypothetical protein
MFMKKIIIAVLCAASLNATAQDNTDSLLNAGGTTTGGKEYVNYTFKSPRVIMAHSVEMLGAGVLDFRILHRFGPVKNGLYDMFGLDVASMRMSFDYGISKDFTIGIGRSTRNKEFDAFVKYRIKQQSKGEKAFPVSLVWASGITCQTLRWTDPTRKNLFSSRLGYYHQLLVARKFSEKLALQLAPTVVHRNLVTLASDKNDMVALGVGGRLKLSRSMALVVDAFPILSGAREDYNRMPLSVGVDIETGGHVFQLHFSNATGMNEKAFIGETTQRWGKSEFQFGFNLSRVFTLKKNKAGSW